MADEEPNDSFSEAEKIGEGEHEGYLSGGLFEDDDYYRVEVPEYKALLMELECEDEDYAFATIFDNERADKGVGLVEDGEKDILFYDGKRTEPYDIYIMVHGEGNYSFKLTFRPSDMKKGAVEIHEEETIEGDLSFYDEVHWYVIEIPANRVLRLSVDSDGGTVAVEILDPEGKLMDIELGDSLILYSDMQNEDITAYIDVSSFDSGLYPDISYSLYPEIGDYEEHPITGLESDLMYICAGVIIAILILLAALYIHYKTKEKKKKPEYPPPQFPAYPYPPPPPPWYHSDSRDEGEKPKFKRT